MRVALNNTAVVAPVFLVLVVGAFIGGPMGAVGAIAVAFAVLGLMAAWTRTIAWVYLLAAYVGLLMLVPVNTYTLPVELPFDLEPQRLVLLLLLALWAASLLVDPDTRFRKTGVEQPLLLLLFVATASLAVNWGDTSSAGDLTKALKAMLYLFAFVAAMYFAASAVRDGRDIHRLLKWLLLLAAVISLFGLIERVTHYNFFAHLSEYVPVLRRNPLFVLDQRDLFRGGGLRIRSSAEHPIAFGGVLALIAPFGAYLSLRLAPGAQRTMARGATALIVIVALLTGSRTALLGLAVGGTVLFLKERDRRQAIIVAAMVLAVAVHFAFPGVLGSFRKTLSPSYISEQEFQEGTQYGRGWAYTAMAREVPKKPLFGVGFNMFDPQKYFYTDNQYLKLLGEVGLAGTFAFLWLNFAVVARLWRLSKRREPREFGLSAALTASCASFAVMSFTYDTLGFPQASILFFVIAGLGCALVAVEEKQGELRPEALMPL